jgi:hypothetical protein
VAARRSRDAERERALVGRAQRARPPPGDLLQGQAQRLGVGELAVQERERELQRRELLVGERDRRQVEVLRPQRVVLLLGDPVERPLDRELDPERVELRAVGVEAAGERVLVHAAVALDVAPDLERGDGPPLRHQVGDQRELADELLGVLRHRASTIEPQPVRRPHCAQPIRSFRAFCAGIRSRA